MSIIAYKLAWSAGASIAWGVFDTGVLLPGVSNGVMQAFQNGQDTQQMSRDAQGVCNQARWAMHKAEQLYYEAAKLTKDIKGMVDGVEPDLLNIETNTHRLQEQIAARKRMFGPMLIISIVGAISVVFVFVLGVAARGKHLRSELDSLRTFESNISEQLAST